MTMISYLMVRLFSFTSILPSNPEGGRNCCQTDDEQPFSSASSFLSRFAGSADQKLLRFSFIDNLMERARSHGTTGMVNAIYNMVATVLSPGPRSFHGLVVSHALNGETEGTISPFYQLNSCLICVNSDNYYTSLAQF